MLRDPRFSSFALFLIVLLISSINKPDSSRDLNIRWISSVSLFKVINVVVLDPRFFSWIPASDANASAVNADGLNAFSY